VDGSRVVRKPARQLHDHCAGRGQAIYVDVVALEYLTNASAIALESGEEVGVVQTANPSARANSPVSRVV
jgi:hypothetical protein